MLISKTHKVIFVHINKTGGSSLKHNLKIGGGHYTFAPKLNGHSPWWIIKDVLDKNDENIWKNYTKIAMVRNPYDWQASMYYYQKGMPWHKDYQMLQKMSFKQFLYWQRDEGFNRPVAPNEAFYMPQHKFICDENNNIQIDLVLKMEEYSKSIDSLKKVVPSIKSGVFHVNKYNNSNYKHLYEDQETKELLESMFEKDFEMFNYPKI